MKKSSWLFYDSKEYEEVMQFSENYKKSLLYKTEREWVQFAQAHLEANGFQHIDTYDQLKKGDKVYITNRCKNIIACIIGEDILSGLHMIVSHIDSPRLDLKSNTLFEDQEFAMLGTHYYGGIKKYQWVATPLALHGVIFLKDGKKVDLIIGEKEDDPVFCIPDILPHLSSNVQDSRKSREVIKGEELQLLFGNIPVENTEVKERVKEYILTLLNTEKYGFIQEEDFIAAEIEVVPAGKARDVGLDKSMIGGYGQDDRICAYTSLEAICEFAKKSEEIVKTAMLYLTDKEEIGSDGSTGLNSNFLEYAIGKILKMIDQKYDAQTLREILWKSKALSADVTAGVDPVFKSVHDFRNAARLSYGIAFSKYTGHRGKSSSSDADAEYIKGLRLLLGNDIQYQFSELGKVDEGGGGTVAKFLAYYGIQTIDAGPPIISMHSLFEVSSKADVFETYKTYVTFYKNKENVLDKIYD